MAQKIEKVFCPSCGAPVTFLEDKDYTFCIHCGHQLFREDTQLEMKLKHKEEMGRQEVSKLAQFSSMVEDCKETIMLVAFLICMIVFAIIFFT